MAFLYGPKYLNCCILHKNKRYVVADPESRKLRENLEWCLCDKVYKNSIHVFGVPEIDLFVSRSSFKISRYVSYTPD